LVKPKARCGTVEVTADGEGLVSYAGTALLVELADRAGVTGALSMALAGTRERRSAHDPGRVLVDVAVMLADGGECVTDLDAYRGQERLFGATASETTTHRVLKSIDETVLAAIRAARARAPSASSQSRSASSPCTVVLNSAICSSSSRSRQMRTHAVTLALCTSRALA
jgi:Transposase DDE domain group 1